MPEEIEVPLEHLHEHIADAHEEAHGGEKNGKEDEHAGWTRLIAVFTALLAVVAAIGSLRAGLLVNEALLSKNDEISLRTQATDQWNYYQSKSIKGVVYATTAQLLPPDSPLLQKSQAEVARYAREQEAIQAKAEGMEKSADAKDKSSAQDMDQHHIFAFSVSLCQIAIALAAIAALTRSRRVWVFSLAAGLAGMAALIGGFLGLHLPFAF
jgi:heme/copper-type cytochrome/quinol oxidase subunit 4